MSSVKIEKHSCDLCGKPLKTCRNNLDIVTSISEEHFWARLHIKIEHIHGVHNESTNVRTRKGGVSEC